MEVLQRAALVVGGAAFTPLLAVSSYQSRILNFARTRIRHFATSQSVERPQLVFEEPLRPAPCTRSRKRISSSRLSRATGRLHVGTVQVRLRPEGPGPVPDQHRRRCRLIATTQEFGRCQDELGALEPSSDDRSAAPVCDDEPSYDQMARAVYRCSLGRYNRQACLKSP